MSRQGDLDNHANQLNPNNDAYWQSRGLDELPEDWEVRAADTKNMPGTTSQQPREAKPKA